MQELLAECDAVITSGGVSVGQKDYLPAVLEQLNADILFAGVAQKPGSPMLAGESGRQAGVLSLRQPLAAAATLEQYAVPALLRAAGRCEESVPSSPHHPHPDHGSRTQQGEPLSAGKGHGRQRELVLRRLPEDA